LLSPRLHATHGVFEFLEHLAFAHDELEVIGLAALEGFAVDLAFEVHGHAVAVLGGGVLARWAKVRRCLRRMSRVLVDGGIAHVGGDFLDFGTGQVADLDFGEHLEHGVERHLAFGRAFFSVMRGWPATRSLASLAALEKASPTLSFMTS
jgi:hypothetical protein